MKQQMYIQCKLVKGLSTHVAWIRKELAIEGQSATFKDEDGVWRITEAYSNVELPWEEINERGQDFKHTREASDI